MFQLFLQNAHKSFMCAKFCENLAKTVKAAAIWKKVWRHTDRHPFQTHQSPIF